MTTPAAALGIADRRSNLYRRVVMLLETHQPLERRCLRAWSFGTFVGGLALLALCPFVRLDGGLPAASADEKSPPMKDAPKTKTAETLHYSGQVVDKESKKAHGWRS